MEYNRYGAKPGKGSWLWAAFLLVMTCGAAYAGACGPLAAWLVVDALMCFFLWRSSVRGRERFSLEPEHITVRNGKKTEEIPLPADLILVVSYASPVWMHTQTRAYREVTSDVIPGAYGVTILKAADLEKVYAFLHGPGLSKYTTATIETLCPGWMYLYSFLGNDGLLEQPLREHRCQVILPRSLEKLVQADLGNATVHWDEQY